MSKLWTPQPLLPPPTPTEYLHAYRDVARGAQQNSAAVAAGVLPPHATAAPELAYHQYVEDHGLYVQAMLRMKDELHAASLLKKAFKEHRSLDTAATLAKVVAPSGRNPINLAPGITHNVVGDVFAPPQGGIHTAAHFLTYKQRVKQTPPAPKPAVVAAKNQLRSMKTIAKTEAIKTKATKVVSAATAGSTNAVAKQTYSRVLATERSTNAPLAAKAVASAQYARALSKLDKVESKRVPLYNRNGGNAAMPQQPSGTFLGPRRYGVEVTTTTHKTANQDGSWVQVVRKGKQRQSAANL